MSPARGALLDSVMSHSLAWPPCALMALAFALPGCALRRMRSRDGDELQGDLFARPMAARLLALWTMGDANTVAHMATDATSGRDDFRDSLYAPDGPDRAIDILQ